ncbi:MAG: MFS transporter [Betaproteobacteria bacterium]|nr:MFS transporter [Betaproteobacteria bacterium]
MKFKLGSDSIAILTMMGEGFFARLSFSVVGFALPLYARSLGLTLSEIGLLISLNVAVAMALKPVMARNADRSGWRRSILAGVGIRGLVPLLLAFSSLPWQLFGIRAVHGMSEAMRDPPVNTLLAVHGEKRNAVASAFAWYATARSVGASLGHAVSGVLLTLTASNFSLVFIVAFGLSAVPLALVARCVPRDSERAQAGGNKTETAATPAAQDETASSAVTRPPPKAFAVAGLGLFMSTTAQMLHGLFPILATEYGGLSAAETGILYALSTFVVLFAGPLFGWLSDRVSRDVVLMVRGGANIVSSGVYLAAPNFPGIAVGRCVDDMGKAAFRPAWGAMMALVSASDSKRRATTISITSLGQDAGEIIGPVLAGLLWNTWGIAVMLGVRIFLAVVTECYALILGRKVHAAEP